MKEVINKLKKFLSKLKGIIGGIGVGILAFANKIYAVPLNIINQAGMIETVYGIPRPSPIKVIIKVSQVFIIPIAMLIGLLVYFKKSKSSKKKKILVILGIIIIAIVFYFIVNKIMYELF